MSEPDGTGAAPRGRVLVRREAEAAGAEATIDRAMAVGIGLVRPVRLVEVVSRPGDDAAPVDPVDWALRRREAALRLERAVARHADARCPLDARTLERFTPDEACDAADGAPPVLAFTRRGAALPWHGDEDCRRFVDARADAVLVVPEGVAPVAAATLGHVLVPLDGSSRAERSLPAALDIARRHGARLTLAHAAPHAPLIENGPLEPEAIELADRLLRRNRRVARDYLADLQRRHGTIGIALDVTLIERGDVRRALVGLAARDGIDLVVLAARGAGGHVDTLSGTVASFVLERAPTAVLMLGAGTPATPGDTGAAAPGLRRPLDVA